MNVDKIVGNNIRKYRTAYNMTLKELAERLHKSISTISKYEKGDISLDLPTFVELAEIFRIPHAALLHAESAPAGQAEAAPSPSEVERLYMYTYDTRARQILLSVIEQHPSATERGVFHAQMFNDVKDPAAPGDCAGLYSGTYTASDFIGTYFLQNQVAASEYVMISCVNNLVNPGQQLGLISGLSNYTMLPISFKVLISSTLIPNRESILDSLRFSKEDFAMMKKTNYLSILNSR